MRTWIKLYTEIIDDPKMGRLTDRQFRTCINLFALAGRLDQDGALPALDDIAWQFRMDIATLTADLLALQAVKVITENDGQLAVNKWHERQAKAPSATPERISQRVTEYRARQRNDGVTTLHGEVKRGVTPIEQNRIDKIRKEAEAEHPNPPAGVDEHAQMLTYADSGARLRANTNNGAHLPALNESGSFARNRAVRLGELNAQVPAAQRVLLVNALLDLTGLRRLAESTGPDSERVLAEAHEKAVTLWNMGYQTAAQIAGLAEAWADDWRGARNTKPTLKQVVELASSLTPLHAAEPERLEDYSQIKAEDVL